MTDDVNSQADTGSRNGDSNGQSHSRERTATVTSDPLANLPRSVSWPAGEAGGSHPDGRSAEPHDDDDADRIDAEGGLLTPGQVARMFGVDPKTVSRWGQQGKLPMRRTLGGHRRFPAEDVYALLERTRGRRD